MQVNGILCQSVTGPPFADFAMAAARRPALYESSLRRLPWKLALRIAAIAAVVAGVYFFARGIDGHALLAALRGAAVAPLIGAAALGFANLFWKAVCWRVMLGRRHRVPVLRLFRYTVTAFASSLLVPARAGEALRVWLLRQRDGVPVTDSAGVALAEKLVDGMAMIIAVTPTLFLIDGLPPWVGRAIGLLLAGAVVGAVVVLIARRHAAPGGLLGRLAGAMTAFDSPRTFVLALGACLGAWLSDFCCVLLVLMAVGIQVPPAVGLLILLGVNVAILIPATPGNLGALEIGAAAALDLVGVPREAAVAFAILYHAVQAIPLLLVGLADLRLALGARRTEAV
jgi:uncharacterized membrane protein YbhN (UPF0104 family)